MLLTITINWVVFISHFFRSVQNVTSYWNCIYWFDLIWFYQSGHSFQIRGVRRTGLFSANDCIKRLEPSKIARTVNHSLRNVVIDFLWPSIIRIHRNSFVIRYNPCSWSFLTEIIHRFNEPSKNQSDKIVRENFLNKTSQQLCCFYKSLIEFFDVKSQLMIAQKRNLNSQNRQNAIIHMIFFITGLRRIDQSELLVKKSLTRFWGSCVVSIWKFIFSEFNRNRIKFRMMQLIRDE